MDVDRLRTQEHRFSDHLRKNANRYFDDISENSVSVYLVHRAERHNSQLYEFRLTDRDTSHSVFVKVPFASASVDPGEVTTYSNWDRPRLFPKTDPHLKGLFEYRSLQAIHDHFAQLGDPRFGTIRVLDLLENPYTIIMEKGRDPGFRNFFRKAHRLRPGLLSDRLLNGCRNSGAWLNEFRNLSPPEHCETRHSKAEEVQSILEALIVFALKSGGRRWFSHQFQQRLLVAAESFLPSNLILGMTHTDFAPRNILLGHNGRITVFDSIGHWRAPIYEDLAYFLIRLKVSMPQMMSQGRLFEAATLIKLEKEFLGGYFGHRPIPMAQIRLYECILLLEQWAAMVCRLKASRGVRKIGMRCQVKIGLPYLSHYISRALSEIEA
ncbi:MAG: hypothetical protein V3V31_14355 [Methylococcales bacterium]